MDFDATIGRLSRAAVDDRLSQAMLAVALLLVLLGGWLVWAARPHRR